VTNGKRTVVLAIFTPIIAEMECVWGCGMDVVTEMLQRVRRDRNDTRKTTGVLSELEK